MFLLEKSVKTYLFKSMDGQQREKPLLPTDIYIFLYRLDLDFYP